MDRPVPQSLTMLGVTLVLMVSTQDRVAQESKDAARLAVLALHTASSIGSPVQHAQWVLLPGAEVINSEDLANALAPLPKFLVCSAARVGSYISVSCEHDSSGVFAERPVARRPLDTFVREIQKSGTNCAEDDCAILVEGSGSSLLVPLRALEAFTRDYGVMNTTLAFVGVDGVARARGAIARVRIGYAGDDSSLIEVPPL